MKRMLWTLSLVLLVFSVFPANGQIEYSVNANRVVWSYANSSCLLATPRLEMSSEKNLTLRMADTADITMREGEELWVGLVQTPELLEYIGCFAHEHHDQATSVHFSTQMDLGQCVTKCGNTKYSAIMKNECYCMDTLPEQNLRRTNCTEECLDDKGVICGGRTTVSIYENLKVSSSPTLDVSTTSTTTGNCVAYNGNSKLFTYRLCTLSFASKCLADTGNIVALGGYKTWRDMTTTCINEQMVPLDFAASVRVTNAYTIWTAMVKASRIYHADDAGESITAYGYVRYENGEYHLLFDTMDRDAPVNTRGFICQTGESATAEVKPDWTTTSPLKSAGTDLLALYIVIAVLVVVAIAIIIFFVVRRHHRKGREIFNIKLKRRRPYNGFNHAYMESDGELTPQPRHVMSHNTNLPLKSYPRTPVLNTRETTDLDTHSGLVATIPLDHVGVGDDGSVNQYDHIDHDSQHGDVHTTGNPYDTFGSHGNHGHHHHGDDGYGTGPTRPRKDYPPHTDNEYAKIHKGKRGHGPPSPLVGHEPVNTLQVDEIVIPQHSPKVQQKEMVIGKEYSKRD